MIGMSMYRSCSEIKSLLLSEEAIHKRVVEIGRQITNDYLGRVPLFVAVLRGAAIFHSDLIRKVDLSLKVDFISVSSYGSAAETGGQVRLLKDLEADIRGLDVILVEDIVDTGLTLHYLAGNLADRGPASLRVCSLLSKPARRRVEVPIDYLGFEIPDEFVVGYGLDFDQKFRNLPFVAVLDREAVSAKGAKWMGRLAGTW